MCPQWQVLLSDDAPGNMQKWYEDIVFELNELIIRIRSNLTNLERKIIVALCTTDVHARDIIEEMVHQRTSKV